MAEDYTKVLAVGIGLFIVFLILAYALNYSVSYNPQEEVEEYKSFQDIINEKGYYYLKTFSIGELGSYKESSRTLSLGRKEIGYNLKYKVIKQDNVVLVKNGIFEREDKEYVFRTENAKKIRLSFTVNRTNRYGKLIVVFNDRIVFRNYTYPGEEVNIEILEDIKGENKIRISCESSGAKIWAPTAYELKDVKVEALDYENSEINVDLYLEPEEYEGLKEVDVMFNVINRDGSGKLKVYVNKKLASENYYNPSADLRTIALYKYLLKPGMNTITLSTDPDTTYDLDNLNIKVIYLTTSIISYNSLSFKLAPSTYRYIKEENVSAFLEFDVSQALVDKGIDVKINGHSYSLSSLAEGENILEINKEDLQSGINVVELSTKGYYNIPRIKVGIRRGEQ